MVKKEGGRDSEWLHNQNRTEATEKIIAGKGPLGNEFDLKVLNGGAHDRLSESYVTSKTKI